MTAERIEPSTPLPGRAPARLFGRDAVVSRAVQRASEGRGTVLRGPQGIGKSAALEAICLAATEAGMRVRRVAALESDLALSLGLLLEVLPPDLADRVSRADPLGRAAALRAAVGELGLDLLAVDDAQMLDSATARFLLELARSNVVVCITITDDGEPFYSLRALFEAGRAELVDLAPLTVAETGELASALLGGPLDTAAVLALHELSSGNPMLLQEIVHDGEAAAAIERTTGLVRLGGPLPTPRGRLRSSEERLRATEPMLREWVEMLALAEQIPLDIATDLVDDDTADRAERDGWVAFDRATRTYRIAHQVHREAAIRGVGNRARMRLLRRLVAAAEATVANDADRVWIGRWRLDLGEPLTPEEALRFAAASTAPEVRERFLRTAVDGGGGPAAMVALASHLLESGRPEAASDLLTRARAERTDPATREAIVVMLARIIGIAGRRSAAALTAVDEHLRSNHDDRLLAIRVALLQRERRLQDALLQATALTKTPVQGAAGMIGGAAEVTARAERGDAVRALRALDALRPLAERAKAEMPDAPAVIGWLEAWVRIAVQLDIVTGAPPADRFYHEALTLRDDVLRARFAHVLGLSWLLQGDVDTAVHLLNEADAAPGEWHDSALPSILGLLTEALVLGGHQQQAEDVLRRLRRIHRSPAQEWSHDAAVAAVTGGHGDLRRAAGIATNAGLRAMRQGAVTEAFDAFYAAIRYGDASGARRLLAVGPLPSGTVRALQRDHATALLDPHPEALDEVARHLWTERMHLYALEVLSTSERRLRASGQTNAAALVAERSTEWAASMPSLAHPMARRTRLTGLTEREREIAALAANGLSDKEIAVRLGISVRTTQTHLGRAYAKLGIHRRRDLGRYLQGLDLSAS